MQKGNNLDRIILGISSFNHDSSAAIIKNNKLLSFSEEERFNEQKNTGAVPIGAVQYCLSKANVSIQDITDIVFYYDIKLCFKSYLKNNNIFAWIGNPNRFRSFRFIYELVWLSNFFLKIRRLPKQLNAKNAKLHFAPHHTCHIWYGIYSANCKEGVVISNDSIGEEISSIAQSWNTDYTGKIKTETIFKQNSPHSIGYLYGAITEYIGFNRKNGAGKVMALASYGNKSAISYFDNRLILHKKGNYEFKNGLVNDRSYKPSANRLSSQLIKTFPRLTDQQSQKEFDLANGVQMLTEKILTHQVKTVSNKTEKIVITGGVAQNSVANGKIAKAFTDNKIIVPPIPHDSGCSIGAALFFYHQLYHKLPKFVDTVKLGSEYSDDEIEEFLKLRKIQYKRLDSLSKCVEVLVNKLLKKQTVGIFRGPMECGQRALGNRSILALPSQQGITDHLNNHVKYREWFRPYGVIVCQSKLHEYFDIPETVNSIPHMTHVLTINPEYKDFFRGVVHVDGTCRVQTIKDDKFYDQLFNQLETQRLSRSIINTSLNVMGKPICRTPAQAIAYLFTSGLDAMIFNQLYLVEKK